MDRSIVQTAVIGFFVIFLTLLPSPARAVADGDMDGIPDALELALAQRFFPILNLHCGSYEGLAYGHRRQLYGHAVSGYPNSSNGRIPFVAHPYSPGNGYDCAEPYQCIEIRYGVAWNWDLGDNILGGSHRGDSEFYAILVARKDTDGSEWGVSWAVAQNDVNQWRLMKEFMAAHWKTAVDSSSFRRQGNNGTTTYQRVWCAEGKHGMYPTQSACNSGGFENADDCSDNRCDIRADVYLDVQNIGELTVPLNRYIPYPAASKTSSPSGSYDVWSGLKFGESGDYKSRLTSSLVWCAGSSWYCAQSACRPGDRVVEYHSPGCALISPFGGNLCESVACY